MLGGDASVTIARHVSSKSVSKIFVNFPEPPERRGGMNDSQGQHMLSFSFFDELYRILKDYHETSEDFAQGTITILSDNLAYLESIAAMLAEKSSQAFKQHRQIIKSHEPYALPANVMGAFESIDSLLDDEATCQSSFDIHLKIPNKKRSLKYINKILEKQRQRMDTDEDVQFVHEEEGDNEVEVRTARVVVRKGTPGVESGHLDPTSTSYFDRMWDKGNHSKRWFLYLKKMTFN